MAELDLRRVEPDDLAGILADGPVGVAIQEEDDVLVGLAVSVGGAQAAYAALPGPGPVAGRLADASTRKWAHDAKALERVTLRAGAVLEGVAFDTMLAGYLLEPGTADYPLAALCERYLGTDLFGGGEAATETEMQLFTEEPWRHVASEAAAVSFLAPVLEEQIDRQGLRPLLEDVELPLASVLARMEARGVRLTCPTSRTWGVGPRPDGHPARGGVPARWTGVQPELAAGLRAILYDQLGLQPGKKTPKGELSTDASVLEKLRDAHPIVDALLSWRELDKLNSTYLEALQAGRREGRPPPHVVQPDRGRHGKTSSSNPNLQNIPIRSELGRRSEGVHPGCRRPGPARRRLLADRAPHPRAPVRGCRAWRPSTGARHPRGYGGEGVRPPPEHVDAEMRRRAKAVNYGLAYGMNAWGLATRLGSRRRGAGVHRRLLRRLPGASRTTSRTRSTGRRWRGSPRLLGRRRYIPELQAADPRVRDLGRRQRSTRRSRGARPTCSRWG